MGLLFQTPTNIDFGDRTEVKNDGTLVLKSMGLPYVFWFYLIAGWVVVIGFFIIIDQPLRKLFATGDPINQFLSVLLYATLILIPAGFTCFYFYEKQMLKNGQSLILKHRLFWLPIFKKTINLKDNDSFFVRHFIDSPNMARINQKMDTKAFQNRGYFELYALDKNEKEIRVDRHSVKADLEKVSRLLSEH